MREISDLIVRMALENPRWVYHGERNHQGRQNRLLRSGAIDGAAERALDVVPDWVEC